MSSLTYCSSKFLSRHHPGWHLITQVTFCWSRVDLYTSIYSVSRQIYVRIVRKNNMSTDIWNSSSSPALKPKETEWRCGLRGNSVVKSSLATCFRCVVSGKLPNSSVPVSGSVKPGWYQYLLHRGFVQIQEDLYFKSLALHSMKQMFNQFSL